MSLSSSSLCSLPATRRVLDFPVWCFCVEGWSSSTRAHSVLCVCGVVVVPGCSGSTWWVFSLHFTGMYQNAGFSPPSPAQTTNKHTHTRSLASTNTANSNVCIKHLCSALSILLGNFPQQTTAFTMINDVKWRKAVPEWDGRFFSAWKQQFDTD